MTWADYVDAVDSHLGVEANRRGTEVMRDRYMRNAVLDLQRYIVGYRNANTTTYTTANVTDKGMAQLVTLPSGAKPKACYIYSADADDNPLCDRYRLDLYPWDRREDMICGKLDFPTWWACCWPEGGCNPPADADEEQAAISKAYVYTIGPMGRDFLIYPQITASTRLLLVWEGYKYTYVDADVVNFPAESSEAVAAYVLWKIAQNVDKDRALAADRAADYSRLRLSLYRDFQETQSMESPDQEYGATVVAP